MTECQYKLATLEPRSYQDEAADWVMQQGDAVVCLPTGTGKTLVGCMVIRDYLNTHPENRVLVLVPSRFLVDQISEYIDTHLTHSEANTTGQMVTTVDGRTSAADRDRSWRQGDIVVATPQTAVNDDVASQFDAVVVDECHHTVGNHAFAQFLRDATFDRRVGLSATIPPRRERTIVSNLGPVRRWRWQDLPEEHVPDWFGDVYDTPYPESYQTVADRIAEWHDSLHEKGLSAAGLASLAQRMLSRDGALALEDTLTNDTKMGGMMGSDLLPLLSECPDLHKLDACRQALTDHAFEKAVIFVDRVAVAERLATALDEYQTVSVLGRLHTSTGEQQTALEQAQDPETDIIIATAAGEEGMDLPAADLLIVWSNVVNAVRFIQRLGRIMRPSDTRRPKTAVYLATPDSPDYEALRRGVARASQVGLDLAGVDEDAIHSQSIITRVTDEVAQNPLQQQTLVDRLNASESKVSDWISENIAAGELCYVYAVPEDLDEWRKAGGGWAESFGLDPDTLNSRVANNFSPTAGDRYYLRPTDIPLLHTDFPTLVDGDDDMHIEVSYQSADGQIDEDVQGELFDAVCDLTIALSDHNQFRMNVSPRYRTPYSVSLMYHGRATEPIITTSLTNATAVMTTLSQKLTD